MNPRIVPPTHPSCVCVCACAYLRTGLIPEGAPLPAEGVERLHGVGGRGAPPAVLVAALRQAAALVAAGAETREQKDSKTFYTKHQSRCG